MSKAMFNLQVLLFLLPAVWLVLSYFIVRAVRKSERKRAIACVIKAQKSVKQNISYGTKINKYHIDCCFDFLIAEIEHK